MAEVRLENVSVTLWDVQGMTNITSTLALDGVNLTVHDGEVMGIVGPTGCGKTTLLKIVAGLIKPDRGRVLFDGVDQKDVPPRSRDVGMVFQDYALYPHFSVWENLGFYFKLRRREEEIPERVREVARILDVDFRWLLGRMPDQLSLGQRQQVAVGRCIIRHPRLFLFDEPFSNLDAGQRAHARRQLKRLLHRFQVTSLYVTHDQQEAMIMSDRLAVMRQGRIIQVDTYRQLIAQPVNDFVAGFIGTPPMNFFSGALEGDDFVAAGMRVPLPTPLPRSMGSGQAVRLGVRPEHVRLLPATGDRGIPATVELREPLLPERMQIITLRLDGQRCQAKVPLREPLRLGEQVCLDFDPDHLYLFDGATGTTLLSPRAAAL